MEQKAQWENITINIRAHHIELTDDIRAYIEQRVTKLGQLLQKHQGDVFAYFEVSRVTTDQQTGEVYRADCTIDISGKQFYASEEAEDVRSAIDAVKEKLYREMRKNKNKSRDLMRRGAKKLKNLLRFSS